MTLPRLALAAGTTTLVLGAIAALPEAPARPGSLPVANAREPERVRIEHELVRIPVTPAPARVPRRAARHPGSAAWQAQAVGPSQAADAAAQPKATDEHGEGADNPGLLSRAVKTIVGDGRHKPQPFPRPGGS